MTTEPQIEAVTEDDVMVAVKIGEMVVAPFVRQALEQDRRRVAERQANHGTTHAEGCASWGRGHYECAMVEIERLRAEVAFYKRRCELLQATQHLMRDPERTVVCDILANGALLPDPDGTRYGAAHAC